MNFNELNEMPGWAKTVATLLAGGAGAKMLSVWLENRRLEKKEYRDTLLGRIRELEAVLTKMNDTISGLKVELALVKDENQELREQLGYENKLRKPSENPPESV